MSKQRIIDENYQYQVLEDKMCCTSIGIMGSLLQKTAFQGTGQKPQSCKKKLGYF